MLQEIAKIIALSLALASKPSVSLAQDYKIFPGEKNCSPSSRLVSMSAIEQNRKEICFLLPEDATVRLAAQGSFSGVAKGCRLKKRDFSVLTLSLCQPAPSFSGIRGILLRGGFRTQEQLSRMSPEDWRFALAQEIANRTANVSTHYLALDDDSLAGAGQMMVYLLRSKRITGEELAHMELSEIRALVRVDVNDQTGQAASTLSELTDLELMDLLFGG